MNRFNQGANAYEYELPDPEEACANPSWESLLTDAERERYTARFEHGIELNRAAYARIGKRQIAVGIARERETQEAKRRRDAARERKRRAGHLQASIGERVK